MTDQPPPGFWARDNSRHGGPVLPLWESVWCEPFTRGFAEAFARWGYLGDGLAGTVVDGWFYMSMRPLSDPGLAPLRCERAAAAAAADEHLAAVYDWLEVVGPGFERRRVAIAAAESGSAAQVETAAALVRDVVRTRFAGIGIHEVVVEWVLQAQERLGWDARRALDLVVPAGRGAAFDIGMLVAAAADVPALRAKLDAGATPTLGEIAAHPGPAAALATILGRHGDMGLALDIGLPTLRERPEHLAGALTAAWATRAVGEPARRADESAVPADLVAALDRARIAYPVRDVGGDLLIRCLGTLRRVALAAGEQLGLATADDALLLTAPELVAALHRGRGEDALVEERRTAYRKAGREEPPLVLGIPPGPPPDMSGLPRPAARAMQRLAVFSQLMNGAEPRTSAASRGLPGVPAASGTYTGTVRVALDVEAALDIDDAEVLVCPVTGPAWNIAMMRAGALVCETGGELSHAAITARELGIPAVVGCRGATAALRTGDRVLVDGAAGVVTPV